MKKRVKEERKRTVGRPQEFVGDSVPGKLCRFFGIKSMFLRLWRNYAVRRRSISQVHIRYLEMEDDF